MKIEKNDEMYNKIIVLLFTQRLKFKFLNFKISLIIKVIIKHLMRLRNLYKQ